MGQKSHTRIVSAPKIVLSKKDWAQVKEVSEMVMWKFKSCPRCGGDTFLDRGLDSWYEQCLQCAYQHELKSIAEFEEQPPQKEKEPALARRAPFDKGGDLGIK